MDPSAPYPPPPEDADVYVEHYHGRRLRLRIAGLALAGLALGALVYGATRVHAAQLRSRADETTRRAEAVVREGEARGAAMARVPAGTYRVGSDTNGKEEAPAHDVTLAAFDIDDTEVTVAAYRECVAKSRCSLPTEGLRCTYVSRLDQHPVNCVSFEQAETYCAWAGKRLPTEEEWEVAAKGGGERRYPWGNAPPTVHLANLCDRMCDASYRETGGHRTMYNDTDQWGATSPVRTFSPAGDSPFGLADMSGNVWEWTASTFCPYGVKCFSPSRVVRGGSFLNYVPNNVTTTARFAQDPTVADEVTGFRCARSAEGQ